MLDRSKVRRQVEIRRTLAASRFPAPDQLCLQTKQQGQSARTFAKRRCQEQMGRWVHIVRRPHSCFPSYTLRAIRSSRQLLSDTTPGEVYIDQYPLPETMETHTFPGPIYADANANVNLARVFLRNERPLARGRRGLDEPLHDDRVGELGALDCLIVPELARGEGRLEDEGATVGGTVVSFAARLGAWFGRRAAATCYPWKPRLLQAL